jgi:hypothetical protein
MAVPPEAAVYQRYCPADPPVAEHVGIPVPHCVLFETVGAVGSGFTVTEVEAEIGHPFSVAVPVNVPVALGV